MKIEVLVRRVVKRKVRDTVQPSHSFDAMYSRRLSNCHILKVAKDGRPRQESLGKPQESLPKQLAWRERSI
jgi:hypothetical protein